MKSKQAHYPRNTSVEINNRDVWRATSELQHYLKNPLDVQHSAALECGCMDEREYRKIKEDLIAEHKRRLEALETIWAIYKPKVKSATPEIDAKPSIPDLVRAVLLSDMIGETFTIWDVRKTIEKRFPESKGNFRKNSLSGTLTRMAQRKEIAIAKHGSGTQASTFRRANDSRL